jgi:hypothetical protein
MGKAALIWGGLLLLAGCATQQQRYAEKLDQIPAPVDNADRQQKCAWIRGEIAQQQKVEIVGREQSSDLTGLATQANAQSKIAALESKANEFNCNAVGETPTQAARAVPPCQRPVPVAETPGPSKIESCIAA